MASVAICPHCYLQLAIPDQAASDAHIECPSCHSEFALEKATVRTIPEGMLKDQTAPAAATAKNAVENAADVISLTARNLTDAIPPKMAAAAKHADTDIATWFKSNKTIPDVVPIVTEAGNDAGEAAESSEMEDDAVTNAEDATPMDEPLEPADEAHHDPKAARQSAVTLADLQALHPSAPDQAADLPARPASPSLKSITEPSGSISESVDLHEIEPASIPDDAGLPGPSFDLPDVPLTLGTGVTVEFSAEQLPDAASGTDFELEDVNFESLDHEWMKGKAATIGESAGHVHDANSETMPDVGLFDQRLRDSTYEESLRRAAKEPAAEYYEHSTNPVADIHEDRDHEQAMHDLPPTLPPQRGGRRKRSALRTLVGAVAGAPIGLAIGYYLVLLFAGPRGDFLQMAKYIPPKFLPASFVAVAPRDESAVASRPEPVAETAAEPAAKDSATVPASFEAPVQPAADKPEPANHDRYATNSPSDSVNPDIANADDAKAVDTAHEEPRRFTAPAATSMSGDEVHIVGAPLYTISEFAAALAQAKEAQPGLVTGDLSDPAVRREKGMSYAKLCDLAQMVTFCDDSSAGDRAKQLRHDADEFFHATLSDAHTRDEVAKIAAIWIGSPHRRHGGVFLSGTIHGGEIAGYAYEYQLSTETGDELRLLLPRPLDSHIDATAHPVGIVGAVVDQPARKVSGYTGTAPRVIWVHDVIPLD